MCQKLDSKNEEGDGKVTVPPGFNSLRWKESGHLLLGFD